MTDIVGNNRKIRSLQFLRFFAFTQIFLLHTRLYDFSGIPYSGTWAVSFFIILSGFLSGYQDEIVTGLHWKEEKDYMLGKVKKLYPLYFVTILVAIPFSGLVAQISNHDPFGMYGGPETVDVWILLRSLLMIQSWFPDMYFSFNAVAWYLSTLLFLYLMKKPIELLLHKIRYKKYGKPALVAIGIAVLLLMVGYTRWLDIQDMNLEFWSYIFPPSRLAEYICGMICGMLVRDLRIHKNIWIFSACECLVAAGILILISIQMPGWLSRASGWIVPNCILISVFALEGGLLSKLFSLRIFDVLGTLSFECFLLHTIVYMYFAHAGLGVNIELSRLGNAFAQAYIFGITLLLAYFAHNRRIPAKRQEDIH